MNTPTDTAVLMPCVHVADDLERHTCGVCKWRGTREQMDYHPAIKAHACPECGAGFWS